MNASEHRFGSTSRYTSRVVLRCNSALQTVRRLNPAHRRALRRARELDWAAAPVFLRRGFLTSKQFPADREEIERMAVAVLTEAAAGVSLAVTVAG